MSRGLEEDFAADVRRTIANFGAGTAPVGVRLESLGVDTPADLEIVRKRLAAQAKSPKKG
jgi:hypothetical protein